ncbi:5451_t:CDS:1 [Funneliformis geosporum]|uniref:18586_t:CDS:1 n=1 Tax=Funneliformis geosporum TaxID=1117311 RepID=A0A9W4SSK0_9GLOM|nr:18586_t:CDS:1 [Funneliformis geosporum]CAI2183000.1 5451_t:CDS:1 [Funneliformis geosporum]
MSRSTPEIIENIYEYIGTDYVTLRNMVLVNRNWCKVGIPYLWKAPFSIDKTNSIKQIQIISTYLSFLNNKEYKFFPVQKRTCLFNYPIYLRELEIGNLFYMIVRWIYQRKIKFVYYENTGRSNFFNNMMEESEDYYNDENIEYEYYYYTYYKPTESVIASSICKLLIKSNAYIENLSVINTTYNNPFLIDELLIELLNFPETKNSLKNLNTLICGSLVTGNVLTSLTGMCHNITKVESKSTKDSTFKKLTALIQNQISLREFTLEDNKSDTTATIISLERHINSLLCINLKDIIIYRHVSIKSLVKCINLEKLHLEIYFHSFRGVNNKEILKPLLDAQFFHLKDFNLTLLGEKTHDDLVLYDILEVVLRNCDENLEKLTLGINFNINSEIFRLVSQLCPNLTILKLLIQEDEDLSDLLILLPNLTNLKTLVMTKKPWIENVLNIHNNPTFKQISFVLPSTVNSLIIDGILTFEFMQNFIRLFRGFIKEFEYNIFCFADNYDEENEAHRNLLRNYGDMLINNEKAINIDISSNYYRHKMVFRAYYL